MKRRRKTEALSKEEALRSGRIKTMQLVMWTLAILVQMSIVKCLEVRAETEAVKASEMTVRFDVEDNQEACTQPDDFYKDNDGVQYKLERWSAEPVDLPSTYRRVEKEIFYDGTEGMTAIPESIEITAQDRERRQTVTAVCQMEEQQVVREEWQDSFEFTVTFHTYDAGYYQLADRMIPYNNEKPELEGCEILLLELAGIPPEDYRVTHVRWSGGVYTDEEGNQCRDAKAFGEKRIRDYRIKYSGTAVFPKKKGWQTVAAYRLPQEETFTESTESADSISILEELQNPQTEGAEAEDSKEQPLTLWERITHILIITIAIGALLFFGGLLLLAILRVAKKLRACYNRRKKNASGG